MQRSPWWSLLLLAGCLLVFVAAPPVRADDAAESEGEAEKADDDEGFERLSDEEAKALEKDLSRAAKRRDPEDILPVLEKVGDRWHPSFDKALLKMLTHDAEKVAERAAEMLSWQRLEDERDAKKLAKTIWKKGVDDRKNNRRWNVQGRAMVAVAAVEGKEPFDKVRYGDLERLWRSVTGDPRESNAPAIIAVCDYVRLTKDKRLCRMLAEEIDEPGATAVNSPTNPPASWWEQRWKMWKQYKADVVETLEELTGQSFKDTASAKAWFEENEKEFGFRW